MSTATFPADASGKPPPGEGYGTARSFTEAVERLRQGDSTLRSIVLRGESDAVGTCVPFLLRRLNMVAERRGSMNRSRAARKSRLSAESGQKITCFR